MSPPVVEVELLGGPCDGDVVRISENMMAYRVLRPVRQRIMPGEEIPVFAPPPDEGLYRFAGRWWRERGTGRKTPRLEWEGWR
jgi:hypothetical protein